MLPSRSLHHILSRSWVAPAKHRGLRANASRAVSAATAAVPSPGQAGTTSPSASSGDAGTPAVRETAQVPSTHVEAPASGVAGLIFRGPIDEDMDGGARHASAVGTLWSNIPQHVRASFKSVKSLDDAPKASSPLLLDTVVEKAKALAASSGFPVPAHWSSAPAPYYGGQIPLAPYKKGQTAAYHYPRILIPREVAHRFPPDLYAAPVFQTSDPALRWQQKDSTLFPRLQGKTTMLLIFSAQPMSGLWTGLRQWMEEVKDEFLAQPKTQILRLHCEEGWMNRRTHQLTKFHLRRQVEADELFTTFVYRGAWKWEYVRALHLYDKELPVVLLLDPLGYVRWHAVGLPTEDATVLLRNLSRSLAHSKKDFV